MKFLNHLYQYANILSLDVVAGAVISSLFFARLLHATVPAPVLAMLAFTVWIIYTLDHLRDARTIPGIASTDRHRFHQKHFRVIAATLAIVTVADLALIWFVSKDIIRAGAMLATVVIAYLVLQRYLKFLKEIFVACLYTAGILLPSLVNTSSDISSFHHLVFVKFFITALMNLLLFSLFDHHKDRNHLQHSFVTWF